MKPIFLILLLLCLYGARGQGSCINGCNAASVTNGVPSWPTVHQYGDLYGVSFDNNKWYRIDYFYIGPSLAKNFQISVNLSTVGNGVPFQYFGGDFRTHYYFDNTTAYPAGPQSYLFIVYKKIFDPDGEIFDIWDQQGQFVYDIYSGCDANIPLTYAETVTESVREYECYNSITASKLLNANGNSVRLDAGQYIRLQPGFESSLSGGNISMFIEGCFGAHRTMSPAQEPVVKGITALGMPVNVYPNPAQSQVSVHVPAAREGELLSIVLYDLNGRLLHSQQVTYDEQPEINVSLESLDAGVYLIHVKGEEINHYQKIIKQ